MLLTAFWYALTLALHTHTAHARDAGRDGTTVGIYHLFGSKLQLFKRNMKRGGIVLRVLPGPSGDFNKRSAKNRDKPSIYMVGETSVGAGRSEDVVQQFTELVELWLAEHPARTQCLTPAMIHFVTAKLLIWKSKNNAANLHGQAKVPAVWQVHCLSCWPMRAALMTTTRLATYLASCLRKSFMLSKR